MYHESVSNPLVSIVIPSFNRYENLMLALQSLEEQTYKDYEIIIVNDASTDERYKNLNKINKTTIINLEKNSVHEKGYFSDSIRNFGIDASNGKYVAFLDDDDYWMPEKLELQIEKLESSEFKLTCSEAFANNGMYEVGLNNKLFNQDIVFKQISDIYKKSELKNYFVKRFNYKFDFPDIWNFKFIKVHNCIITSSVVVDKNLILQIGKFRDIQSKKLWSDWDCWLGLLTHTDCFYFSKPLIYYDLDDGMNKNTL